jgi:Protein of unknown function (DUF998)
MSRSTRIAVRTGAIPYTSDIKTRLLLICGALAGPIFTIIWLITGLNRANYDPMRHPISSLAIGEFGWTQVANFLITGILTLAFAFGLREALQSRGGSKWAVIWIAALGIGLIGAGLFVADPMNGYPPGTPLLLMQPTVIGRLHRLFSALVFFGLPGAGFTLARLFVRNGERTSANYFRWSAIAFLVMFVLTSVGFAQVGTLPNYAGLLQRITLLIGLTWMTFLSIYLLKPPSISPVTGRQ